MRTNFLFTLLLLLIFAPTLIAQDSSTPTISAVGESQEFCLTENDFTINVKIELNDYEGAIEYYEIVWGDGNTSDPIPFVADVPVQNHTYDFSDFFGTCQASEEYTIRLNAYPVDGGSALNSAFFPLFLNPPKAQFELERTTVCIGQEVVFGEESCPVEGLEIVAWRYGDGTEDVNGRHTYSSTNTFSVMLVVKNECGRDSITKNITVINPAEAIATATDGVINSDNPYTVCLGDNNGIVYLDGVASESASTYEWKPNSGSGFRWLGERRSRARDTIQFLQAGIYPITLTVDNTCNIPSDTVLVFEVIEAEALSIRPQADVCEILEYTPDPFFEAATYTINDEIISNFPITLLPDEYLIEARFENACGPQFEEDDFRVLERQTVNILTPDTTICTALDSILIQIDPPDALGTCFANGEALDSCLFDLTNAREATYNITFEGTCISSNSRTINIVQADTEVLRITEQADACEMLIYTPDPFFETAIYTINGEIAEDFPLTLSPDEYLIEASFENACGPQSVIDDFRVLERQMVNILTPDTTICSGSNNIQIQIAPSDLLGTCLANGEALDDCIFNTSNATEENYTITFEGECLESNSRTINVIQTENLRINPVPSNFCIEDEAISISATVEGGIFSAKGIEESNIEQYDPSLAGVGLDTICYSLDFITESGERCPAKDFTIVNIYPSLQADFLVLDCIGNQVRFDTIATSKEFSRISYEFGDGRVATGATPTHNYNTPGEYEVTITIEQTDGCTFSQTRQITVEAPPVAGFGIQVDPSGCSPLSVNFLQQSEGMNLSYFWDFGNGDTTTLSNPSARVFEAFGQDETYTVRLTVQNGCSSNTIEETIFVKAGPSPFFEIDKDLHCSGEELAFRRIEANADDNSDFWFWDFGNGRTFEGKNPGPIIYEVEQQDTFMVSLTVGNQCDTTTYTERTIVIPSDVTAFMNVDKTIGCADAEFRFINASGVPNAEFFFSDNTTALGDTIYKTFQTSIDSFFQVRMRVFGCGYDDTLLQVRALPLPDLELEAPPEICEGEPFRIQVNSDVAGIELLFGNGDSLMQNIAEYAYEESGTYTLTARATSSGTPACQTSVEQAIGVQISPTAGFEIGALPYCVGAPIALRDTSMGQIVAWNWSLGDGNVRDNTTQIQYPYAEAREYTIKLEVENELGCRDSTMQLIEINPLPTFIINYQQVDPCQPVVQFENTTTANQFLWNFADGNTDNNTNPQHRYEESGEYETTLTATLDGCTDSTILLVQIPQIPSLDLQYTQAQNCPPSVLSVDLSASTEVETYNLDFGEGTISSEAVESHSYRIPGNYTVYVSATKAACTIDSSFVISVGDTLLAEIAERIDVACFGESTGLASAAILSGNAPYRFEWSEASIGEQAENLAAGNYQITISDNLDCTLVLDTEITQPDAPLSNTLVQLLPISCYDSTDGYLEIAAQGGTPPYRYLWEDNNRERSREDLPAANYAVSITDANACTFATEIALPQPAPLQIAFQKEDLCFGEFGNFTVEVVGGTPPFMISSSSDFDDLGNFYNNLPAGNYTVYVEDVNGCPKTGNVEIIERPDWNLNIRTNRAQILKGDSTQLQADVSISAAILSWNTQSMLDFSSESQTWVRPLASTNFWLVAEDEFGCTKIDSLNIAVKDTSAVYIPNAFTPGGNFKPGDGVNDFFTAHSHFPAVEEIVSMTIVNRWGQILYRTENIPLNIPRFGWDGTLEGKPQDAGEYAYNIVIRYIDGQTQRFKGLVRLIR